MQGGHSGSHAYSVGCYHYICIYGFPTTFKLRRGIAVPRFLFLKNQTLTVALVLGRQPKLIATMKKLFLIVAAMFAVVSFSACSDDDVPNDDSPKLEFEDPNFFNVLLNLTRDSNDGDYVAFINHYDHNRIDINKDGQISEKEAYAVTYLSFQRKDTNIKDMDGIGNFPQLIGVRCNNTQCTSLDLSHYFPDFYILECHNNKNLKSIDLSGYYSPSRGFITLELSDNPNLELLILNKRDQNYYVKDILDAIIQEYGDIITYVD